MVVMGIMLILAGLTTGAAFALINRSNNKGAENLLEQIANGLEAYSLDHAMFVPSDDDESSRPLWYALEHDGEYVDVIAKFKYYEKDPLPNTNIYDIPDPLDPNKNLTHFIYLDPWKTELHYECTGNFRTATITSAGRDKVIGSGDDITKTVVKGLE